MNLPAKRRTSAAFSLVEVALATGIAGFCLLAVFGLVPLGVSTGQTASDQIAANSILTHVLADLRATPMTSPPGGAATSKEYKIPIGTPEVLYFGSAGQQFSESTLALAVDRDFPPQRRRPNGHLRDVAGQLARTARPRQPRGRPHPDPCRAG